jgi:hypothetical protein
VHSVGLTVVAAVALVLGSVFLFPRPEHLARVKRRRCGYPRG